MSEGFWRVASANIELLAIKLYEHDDPSGRWPGTQPSWLALPEDVRQRYREMAAGTAPVERAIPLEY